jgi:hypothetical protein
MRHHLPVLSLFTLQACRPTAVAFLTLRMHFPLSSHLSNTGHYFIYPFLLFIIVRLKSLLHMPNSPLYLSSDIHLFFQASRPPDYSLTLHRTLEVRGSAQSHTHITIDSQLHTQPIHYLCLRLRPCAHHGLYTAPASLVISALDFVHSRTMLYKQLQPIPLFLLCTNVSFLPRTPLIRAPRFTCNSSLLYHFCPGLRPFAYHDLYAVPAYSIISAPDCTHSRTTSFRLSSCESWSSLKSRSRRYTYLVNWCRELDSVRHAQREWVLRS